MALYSSQRRHYWRTHRKPLEISIEDIDEGINENPDENIDKEINKENSEINNSMDTNLNTNDLASQNRMLEGRKNLDEFLKKDFSQVGYTDALANSDNSNSETAKKRLMSLLEFEIGNALSWYETKIMDCDSRIKIEKKAMQLDLADEIECQKEKLVAEKERIEKIRTDAANNIGIGLMPVESYDRGFKRGRSALTAAIIFGKTIPNE